ncbi:MAG: hypothetical protein HZA93_17665 [Verrucomicrobia bacterium]|nr:hypothetical protein [Verrucomicrobiota bacterium]
MYAHISRGGTAVPAHALESAVRAADGRMRSGTNPARMVVKNGRAAGVVTTDGEEFKARKFVAQYPQSRQ